MDLLWQDLHHADLSVTQLYDILALRSRVFVVEQQCVYQDIDGADLRLDNRHILGMLDDKVLAYARILTPEATQPAVRIGRVIISPEARGLNLGYRLMEQAIASCEQHWPGKSIYLSAQAHLQGFYARLGFKPVGEIYLEDDIPHIGMQN
ncbi:GNAT family N-acetyltransferase [Erwiniaceae bacterium BAC15a-03b]|uniref:Protein ElaA n=1 Tax=Winslowiella arboricola TaxID=2978220 RepID=A0A9J6PJZ1_9GAMM|nr:GNAT family N-acetyltransferase [Winslowiella arboricola]MCU5772758.1 GNAT family N-acetyltransferase [Winslowiella arboricola]MCU5777062.1 GNAT family N-acetyltransferase [Winslowiella arboricola]